MNHSEKLQKCLDAKDEVEIIAKDKILIKGVLSEVGTDYVAIVFASECEITETITITEGKHKGETEEQKRIKITELETILRLKDICAVSRVLRATFK